MKKQLVSPNRVGIRNSTDYSPFGVELEGRTVSVDGYRFGFQNQEKDDEIKGESNSIDFGARIYDPRIGRWFSLDLLLAKRPAQTPYSFVGNKPNMNKELYGHDYEIIVDKSEKGNTITIRAVYYTDVKGSESFNTALKATEFWNSQNGKFKYQVTEDDGTVTEYDVIFQLTVKEVSEESKSLYGAEEGIKLDAYDDDIGNSLIVKQDAQITDQLFGATSIGQFTEIAYSRKSSDTPQHEIGHTLNLGHFLRGLMKEIDRYGTKTREPIIYSENVQQIIDFAIGKGDMSSSTAPAIKAKTIVINPKNEKLEGKIVEANDE